MNYPTHKNDGFNSPSYVMTISRSCSLLHTQVLKYRSAGNIKIKWVHWSRDEIRNSVFSKVLVCSSYWSLIMAVV